MTQMLKIMATGVTFIVPSSWIIMEPSAIIRSYGTAICFYPEILPVKICDDKTHHAVNPDEPYT